MTIEQAIELGRAWPRWEWAPGQFAITPNHRGEMVSVLVDDVAFDLPHTLRMPTASGMWMIHDGGRALIRLPDRVPDLRDPGTRGHALEQVRRAWRDHRASLRATEDGFEVVGHAPGDDGACAFGRGATEAEALLDAARRVTREQRTR